MPVRSLSALLLVTYPPLATGCHHNVAKPLPASDAAVSERLAGVVMRDGRRVEFQPQDGRIESGWIIGTHRGSEIAIPSDSIGHILVRRSDGVATAFLVVGVAALALGVAGGIAAATKESCPFVYSWNGTSYAFDAEPYGGAISRGLIRDDYGQLDHLKPIDGEYRLRVVNEVNESQWTDLMELWVIDHPRQVLPIPDEFGRLYTVAAPGAPLSVRDQQNHDLARWLHSADMLLWEPLPPQERAAALRDTVTMVFTKPPAASGMKLVARVATASWGSHQIRSLLSRMGTGLEEWYRRIDQNEAAADSVRRWAIREGLYGLTIEVRETDGWRVRGILPGGGPFIGENRVVPLDVSRVEGSEVTLRIQPARGFWSFDWFAADFTPEVALSVDTLRVLNAEDSRLGDVTSLLLRADGREHPLPKTGDRALVRFSAPEPRAGLKRTILLHSRGWYHLQGIPSWTGPEISMDQLLADPGLAARLSADEYRRAVVARQWQPQP